MCDPSKWWSFLTYDSFKSHVNVTDALNFSEERIKVGKEEDSTSNLNQVYDKFQATQYKSKTRQLLELARQKVHGRINQCQIIMTIYTVTQKIPEKV